MYKGINRPKVCRLHSIFTQTQCIPLLSSYNIGSKGVKGGFSQPLNTLVGMTGGSATSWRDWTPKPPQIQPWCNVNILALWFAKCIVAVNAQSSLFGISPSYLADDCRLVADARERRLRSTVSRTCVVTRTYSIFGDRAFAAARPGLWNSLPSHLKEADLPYYRFRRSLNTFLFR